MQRSRILLCVAAPLALAACEPAGRQAGNENNASAAAAGEDSAPLTLKAADLSLAEAPAAAPQGAAGCPVSSSGWVAFVQPLKGVRKLAVAGLVETPTTGWQLDLAEGQLDKSLPPTQHFTLTATAPAPGQIVLPVKLPRAVGKVIDAQPSYAAVVVDCGGKEIARITDIEEKPEIDLGPDIGPEENKQ